MQAASKMKSAIERAGLPFRRIDCYGSQIVVTADCRETATKWASLLAKIATVKGVIECLDYAQQNKKTCLNPSMVKVFRAYATI